MKQKQSNDTEFYLKVMDLKTAARIAIKEIDKFYLKSEQRNRSQTIHEDDHDLWFGRDELESALKKMEGCYENNK